VTIETTLFRIKKGFIIHTKTTTSKKEIQACRHRARCKLFKFCARFSLWPLKQKENCEIQKLRTVRRTIVTIFFQTTFIFRSRSNKNSKQLRSFYYSYTGTHKYEYRRAP